MSLRLYIESSRGVYTEETDRIRADTIQLTIHAEEASVGSSSIEIDDPDADFFIQGLRGLYFLEEEATGDERFGLIGPFYAWDRDITRGSFYTDTGRTYKLTINDVNTLLTRRLQKGADAERPQETDVSRMQWLVGTPEVIGGDLGADIEDTDFLFTDSPYQMDKTTYVGQDSAGVINDALQDSGKNCFLFHAPVTAADVARVGIWYGRTERTEFSSVHRISNVLTDVDIDPAEAAINTSAASLIAGEWTFAPSRDATLNRDPSRVASGVMVQYDGGYVYEQRPSTSSNYNRRDMLMQAELVKTSAQASRRAQRYLRDLRDEDDAIETAVVVPAALIHAFLPGHRVQVKFNHLPGYDEFTWMRVAAVTYRQLAKDSRLYELALDLRAESPPDTTTAVCASQTASTTFYPLGGAVDTPNASDGHVYYWNPGEPRPIEVADMLGEVGHWHFPQYGAGGSGTTDYAGDCSQNRLRILVEGNGTLTINTATFGGSARTLRATLSHHRYGAGGGTDETSGVDILDAAFDTTTGNSFVIPISTHGGQNCTHWVDVVDAGGTCGGKWGWTSAPWVAS